MSKLQGSMLFYVAFKESGNSKEQQQELSNALQVQSRKRLCKKKEAQQDGKTDAVKVISEREKEAITEKQCELINQMGLTHGGDIQQIMGMMVDMEKRDNKLAAGKGENTLNHDNTFL